MPQHATIEPVRLPHMHTTPPGPQSVAWVEELIQYECPAITARRNRRSKKTGVGRDPIVWERAQGSVVEDVDGNQYIDLAGAFAVASVGHRHPRVVEAAHQQVDRLLHAMGDVFPSTPKIALARELARSMPGDLQQSIFAQSGASAVEAALKTAALASGKPGVIAFHGGYHGLSYGALAATAYRREFRAPFQAQMGQHVTHVPYPGTDGGPYPASKQGAEDALSYLEYLLTSPASGVENIGAVLVEPIQGRGGEITPHPIWLQGLRALCDRHGLILVADEIYTGLGRTGAWLACEHVGVLPDIVCVGKALGGGFPLSAAIGRASVMEAWGQSQGEAIHTSTFLGNPLGCAMGIATLQVLREERLVERAASLGAWFSQRLDALRNHFPDRVGPVRGMGMMLGLPIVDREGKPDGTSALQVVSLLLRQGYILLPSGVYGHVLAFAPPLNIHQDTLDAAVAALEGCLRSIFDAS